MVIAGALATAVAGSALAQSNVTIYGLIDAGVIGTNHAGTANANVNAITSGVDLTSRLGFRSVEHFHVPLMCSLKTNSLVV